MKNEKKTTLAKRVLVGSMAAVMAFSPAVFANAGAMKIVNAQTTVATLKAAKTKSLAKATVTVSDAVFSGKALKPAVKVTYGKTKLKSGRDYTVSYSSNKNIGIGTVTVKAKAKSCYSGSKSVKFKIVPAKPKLSYSATASTITLKWNKVSGANYYIVYSVNPKTKKLTKLKKQSETSFKLTKLKEGMSKSFAVKAVASKNGKNYESKAAYLTATTAPKIPSASDKKAVAKKFNELINTVKNQNKITIDKESYFDLAVTDCSATILTDTLDNIVRSFLSPTYETYKFTNAQISSVSVSSVITPCDRETALSEKGIKTVSIQKKNGGYQMKIKLVKEKSYFDGSNTVNPVHHESCLSPLNIAALELPAGAKITEASMDYPGAILDLTVDKKGKLTDYKINLPVSGSITGKLGVSLSVGLEGTMHETYHFDY